MKSITKIIIGLVGIMAIGLLTYYIVTETQNQVVNEKQITNPDQDTVAIAQLLQDTKINRIISSLGMEGEDFKETEDEGVYINSTNDKILIIKEDIWEKIISKARHKFPATAIDCNQKFEIPDLSEYQFVGLLTYLATSKNSKSTSAYSALEIRVGNAKYFAGGDICCSCEGVPLVPQQVDAVIHQ